MLHSPYIRPRSRFEYHAVIATTPPGAPKLWNQPLSPHSTTASTNASAKPIAMQVTALVAKLKVRNRRMLQ